VADTAGSAIISLFSRELSLAGVFYPTYFLQHFVSFES
jgi:hypothetical protein